MKDGFIAKHIGLWLYIYRDFYFHDEPFACFHLFFYTQKEVG